MTPHEQERRAASVRRLDEVAAFVQAHSRFPCRRLKLAREDEEQSWVRNRRSLLSRGRLSAEDEARLRHRAGKLSPEREAAQPAVCAGWASVRK